MFVKPAPGLLVRDPFTFAPLPPEGREVSDDAYWLRRLRDGDVVMVDLQAQAAHGENSP